MGIPVREQAGVTTDLGQDPTLVSGLSLLSYVHSFIYLVLGTH